MTQAQIFGFVLICLMIGIVYLTTKYVSAVRYRGHGLYYITVNAWFRRNQIYLDWLKENRGYHWCVVLIIALCPMILLLIEPFRENRVFERPEATIYINVVLWIAIFFTYKWLFKKLEQCES